MVVKPKVVWSIEATIQLKAGYNYIARDSIKNARKVRNDIVEIAKRLPSNPEVHPPTNTKLITMAVIVLLKNIVTGSLIGH